MASPPQSAIDTFVGITGASEAVAVRKLEEHGGDLNEAINAHFNEGQGANANASAPAHQTDFMDTDDPIDVDTSIPAHPLLSAAQTLNPFSLINSSLAQRFLDGGTTGLPDHAPRVSHPREVTEIPIEFKDGDGQPTGSSRHGPAIEEVTGSVPEHGPEVRGTVIIDDEDEDFPSAPAGQANEFGDVASWRQHGSNVHPVTGVSDFGNDIEEEMIQAAIEASKREAQASTNKQFDVPNGSSSKQLDNPSPVMEDDDFAHAVSMSLKTAEQEKALRGLGVQVGQQSLGLGESSEEAERVPTLVNGRQGSVMSGAGASGKWVAEENYSSGQEDSEDADEQPLVWRHTRRSPAENTESANLTHSPPTSPDENDPATQLPNGAALTSEPNGAAFTSDEWGGISSEEHDEAVMLEAAMFGGIPEGGPYNFRYPRANVLHSDGNSNFYPRSARPPSPFLTAQRLLREQQDDEYLAALQADREKELKAAEEAERCQLEEAAARQAALEEQKHREEEAHRKLIEEEEFERMLAAKHASLPSEPSSDDESAVTLLIRMPDGSRCGRRFLKSDKLQSLFDYIDTGKIMKPGTYRLVRPYPRRAFTDGESTVTLGELGLTSKQEALFLELI